MSTLEKHHLEAQVLTVIETRKCVDWRNSVDMKGTGTQEVLIVCFPAGRPQANAIRVSDYLPSPQDWETHKR